jgi:hypothetical protein
MKPAEVRIGAAIHAPVANIKHVTPETNCDFRKCETTMQFGLFFDGTNNNRDHDRPLHADSNISRLYDTYSSRDDLGYYRVYIPGVGTKFPGMGDDSESSAGSGFAIGCEARVLYALLILLDALHRQSFPNTQLFDEDQVRALCRNNGRVRDEDRKHLLRLGMSSGLLPPDLYGESERRDFLKRQVSVLEAKLRKGKPRVIECFLDVFGFSRGAAEARVFCQWLDEILIGGKLAGVPLRFRFAGLIDTVASAGFLSGATALAAKSTGGHSGWAQAEFLRIPSIVENCVHFVAMHELRRNFPLDEIGINGTMPPRCHQYAYPGAHSDVGGGYAPGELGVSVGENKKNGDSLKLSQIPLNHMLDCAVAAGAPMRKPVVEKNEYDAFAIHPRLTKAYADFLSTATLAPRPMYEWLQPYLDWRWQVRKSFGESNQVKLAGNTDKQLLLKFNNSLISDAEALIRTSSSSWSKRALAVALDFKYTGARNDLRITSLLDPEAPEVLRRAQSAKPTPAAFATLFDGYVHDSLAGFNEPALEYTGYWRYRKVFLGDDRPVVATNQDGEIARNAA